MSNHTSDELERELQSRVSGMQDEASRVCSGQRRANDAQIGDLLSELYGASRTLKDRPQKLMVPPAGSRPVTTFEMNPDLGYENYYRLHADEIEAYQEQLAMQIPQEGNPVGALFDPLYVRAIHRGFGAELFGTHQLICDLLANEYYDR